MADILTEIRKIPPVTRFLVGSSLGITIPALMKLVSPYHLIFLSGRVLDNWEVRLMPTSCLVFEANLTYSSGECTQVSSSDVSIVTHIMD
jgi:Derlin-2/3